MVYVEANNEVAIGFYVKKAYRSFTFRLLSLLGGASMMLWIALIQHSQYIINSNQWSTQWSTTTSAF